MEERDDIVAIATALGCTPTAAAAFYAAGRVVAHHGAVTLVPQGESAERSWLILDGAVRCEVVSPEGRNTVVSSHPTGDIVGGFGLGGMPLAGSLTTVGKACLLSFSDDAVSRLAADDPDFAVALARSFARQSGLMLQRLAARISLTAAGRIYVRLLDMAGPSLTITPAPVVSALAISVQTTRETTSRTLSALERRGIIRRDSEALVIQSPRMLEDMIV